MGQEQVTTFEVGAQESCALHNPVTFAGMGSIEQQPYFKPIARRDLMAAVNTIAKDLGLRASSVMVIDALLSCLPCKDPKSGTDAPVSPRTLLTVYAANATLCFRAKGITDRQLRRHLERLEEVGLIRRKDSANGKRFPIYRAGRVIGAFGIDLSPLLERSEEFCELAQTRRKQQEELRGLRSCIQKLRMECQRLPLTQELNEFLDSTRNIMRRASTTLTQAYALIKKLRSILVAAAPPNDDPRQTTSCPVEQMKPAEQHAHKTAHLPATDGQNDRHKEPRKSYTKKTHPKTFEDFWKGLALISEFYPNAPNTEQTLVQIIFEVGMMLRIKQRTLSTAIARIGLRSTLHLQDRIASQSECIANPDAYLMRIVMDDTQRQVGHGQLPSFA